MAATIKVYSADRTVQEISATNPLPVAVSINDAAISADNPSPVDIRRGTTATVYILNGAAVSGEIDMRLYTMLIVHMPAAWTAASLGFQVSPTSGGTFQPLYDDLGNLVQIAGSTTSRSYQAPPELAGCRYVKLWSQNGTGTNTNQAADRAIGVSLKA